ncbi:universal stress protein [Thermomonospora sp. CIF 1]|uniref:universal stress protein n=1 Tax=Thermomonospora sp. CIF 1 TaxID=1916083 RepID=UPI000ACC4CA8|nr:universal stress protein [Thermomonospora sp. CIF 1]PKK14553.1 MAG: universal stress protein UspA [Thermomonospora sp. CIF 1]
MKAPVIVGIDGSARSLRALDWAVEEARLLGAPLRLVHASRLLAWDGALTEEARTALKAERTGWLERAAERARRRRPGCRVETELPAEDPVQALVKAGENASLIVVGARGSGGFEGLLLGSVGLFVASRATCPIMVVPESAPDPEQAPGRIVLGVDKGRSAEHAIGWAFAEADRRGAALIALHAIGTGYGSPRQRVGEQMHLAEALAGWTSRYPDLTVERRPVEGKAAAALVAASQDAALVVVGARRRHGLPGGMALGRVNHAVLHHSRCPVVVVPAS